MNHAITVNAENKITGVHHSLNLFGPWTFEFNPILSNDKIIVIKDPGQYERGRDIRCYEKDGTLKDELWCIQQGYMALPPGKEIIEGKLVDVKVPETEAEETVKQILLSLRNEIAGLKETVTEQAARIERVELKTEPISPIVPIKEVTK